MSKSFAITLILCGVVLIGSAIMDGIDMRQKNKQLEADKMQLNMNNTQLQSEIRDLKEDMKIMDYSLDKIIKKDDKKKN